MFGRLKDFFDLSFQVFDSATLRGFYFLPFIAATAYLLLFHKEKHKKLLTWGFLPCVIGLLILLSPIAGKYAEGRDLAQIVRFYWPLPFGFAIMYCIVDFLWHLKDSYKQVVFFSALALGMLTASFHLYYYTAKNTLIWSHEKAENPYKISVATYEVCNIISEQQNGKECRAAFPHDIAMQVRQYDANITMPYGFYFYWKSAGYPCFEAINAGEVNLDDVEQAALEDGLDYFVLNQDRIVTGFLHNYSLLGTVQDSETTYGIYARQTS